MEFFRTLEMLKILNHTVITIIPKSSHATNVGDYRPIAGCNTIYKVISKMLCNRLREILPTLIAANQSAFIAGRTIVQNVLICQDLVRLYKRKNTTQSCLIKIDLRKTYDSIEWSFVEEMLHAMNFPQRFIKWIMACITTTKYSIAINGGLYRNIVGKRGLRQGDPISPLLFVICMEYLTRILNKVADMREFGYHTKCRGIKLNHLCFADDILLFCKGNYQSAMLMLRGLQSFTNASRMTTNAGKSNIFSANMPKQELEDLCEATGYQKGTLPFRYLGVPISAKKLSSLDCEVLIDKTTARIRTWSSRNMSYAGRVQLINVVLLHVHTYWSSIFILPKAVMEKLIAICRNHLWDGKEQTNKAPLIAWDIVCRPKCKGGLGIKDCLVWNEAAIAKYIWNIAQKADNLWVKWVNHVYIKEASWDHYVPPNDCSWYWKRICNIKEKFKDGYRGNDWQHIGGRERLEKIGICTETRCEICGGSKETIQHLYFECQFSKECLKILLEWLGLETKEPDIAGIWRRLTRRVRGKMCRKIIIAAMAALVYKIWQVRNDAIWNNKVAQPQVICR
ncbi:PREDICTED: uncharacterized protein LOC109206976 [Nicotiana attenuata]|uniref:uncharacterized protein LOC109206976 n=1 Tax=Nicotiana attenuata TaxID=49451 RepID=UPI00090483EF|nr:PREDICTED: uncharacterized protein LOC109206976 [Nicotiana attenuata]